MGTMMNKVKTVFKPVRNNKRQLMGTMMNKVKTVFKPVRNNKRQK
jgi:hypothetical protein